MQGLNKLPEMQEFLSCLLNIPTDISVVLSMQFGALKEELKLAAFATSAAEKNVFEQMQHRTDRQFALLISNADSDNPLMQQLMAGLDAQVEAAHAQVQ